MNHQALSVGFELFFPTRLTDDYLNVYRALKLNTQETVFAYSTELFDVRYDCLMYACC